MRRQFKLQDYLKDKSQKVETRDGRIVHNIWPVKEPLIFNDKRADVCALIDGEEDALVFFEGGKYLTVNSESPFDLFIVTPEEEMSEWQRFISACLQKYGLLDCGAADRIAKECSAELLDLAREQFIKDGYVIEKKAFHDAVENISDNHRAEMSVEYSIHCKVEDGTRHAIMNWETFQKVAQKFIDIGKAEALRTRATELTKNLAKSGLDKDSIPYHIIEFMCNLYTCQNWKEIEETAEAYATRIKAAALKDLPRWKISLPEPGKRYVLLFNGGSIVESRDYRRGNFYYEDGEQYKNIEYNPKCVRWMYAEELYQLPGGFKED